MSVPLPGDVLRGFRVQYEKSAAELGSEVGWQSAQVVYNLESISSMRDTVWRVKRFPLRCYDDLLRTYPSHFRRGSRLREQLDQAMEHQAWYLVHGPEALGDGWVPPAVRCELRREEIEHAVRVSIESGGDNTRRVRSAMRRPDDREYQQMMAELRFIADVVIGVLGEDDEASGRITPDNVPVRSASEQETSDWAIETITRIARLLLEDRTLMDDEQLPPDPGI